MRNKGSKTKEVKLWESSVAQMGCVITNSPIVELHHCIGEKGKFNKQPIGYYFLLPIHPDLHNIRSNHPRNLTLRKKAFIAAYGTEKDLFFDMVDRMANLGVSIPPIEILESIRDWRR